MNHYDLQHKPGDPVNRVANAEWHNAVGQVLDRCFGIGCRVEKDHANNTLAFIVDGSTDEIPDTSNYTPPVVRADSTPVTDYLTFSFSGNTLVCSMKRMYLTVNGGTIKLNLDTTADTVAVFTAATFTCPS